MYPDVETLTRFYTQTARGRIVCDLISRHLGQFWPDVTGSVIAAYGFAVPFIKDFVPRASRVVAIMPAAQGACHWSSGDRHTMTVLADSYAWPFANGFFDRIVMVHGLEQAILPDSLLSEAWRTLVPGGRMIVVVSNRQGLWSKFGISPFRSGQCYSAIQLYETLCRAGFCVSRTSGALYFPPLSEIVCKKIVDHFERFCTSLRLGFMAGTVIVEVIKVMYAASKPLPSSWISLSSLPSSRGIRGKETAGARDIPLKRESIL